ncbi:unnamed protein product [Prorocentrum cordatum]|uniref:Uncharacterized protein n=1 Tax=Prorocentrum cordatum TaxID=2364126 RepID=A0ABN9XVU6_9DINO|nr:unnamed protein product [Polarella glacialis]
MVVRMRLAQGRRPPAWGGALSPPLRGTQARSARRAPRARGGRARGTRGGCAPWVDGGASADGGRRWWRREEREEGEEEQKEEEEEEPAGSQAWRSADGRPLA